MRATPVQIENTTREYKKENTKKRIQKEIDGSIDGIEGVDSIGGVGGVGGIGHMGTK